VATATHSVRRKNRPLFEAGKLRCPHDKKLHDVLSYKRFDIPAEFSTQLNVILRCFQCGHLFSPALDQVEMDFINNSLEDQDDY
jgi:hypothetical protein